MRADQAKGYGLCVAKVVAARKFGRLRARLESQRVILTHINPDMLAGGSKSRRRSRTTG